jgi:Protein of unknown function (DUF3800)
MAPAQYGILHFAYPPGMFPLVRIVKKAAHAARSFGGGCLEGDRLVRFVFLDEAGTSGPEPIAVVGGVFVHGDEQIIPLEDHLEELVKKHIPTDSHDGFVFHATDIWSGTGFFKNKDDWPWEKRGHILEDLCKIPSLLDIPIIFAFRNKLEIEFPDNIKPLSKQDSIILSHAHVFMLCTLAIEENTRNVWPGEIVQLVAEDNGQSRAAIKQSHDLLRNSHRMRLPPEAIELLPLKKIRGAVHFAEKRESKPLQLADVCAFIIRRRLAKNDIRCSQFYDLLKPMMMVLPKSEAPPESLTLYPFGPLAFPLPAQSF